MQNTQCNRTDLLYSARVHHISTAGGLKLDGLQPPSSLGNLLNFPINLDT